MIEEYGSTTVVWPGDRFEIGALHEIRVIASMLNIGSLKLFRKCNFVILRGKTKMLASCVIHPHSNSPPSRGRE